MPCVRRANPQPNSKCVNHNHAQTKLSLFDGVPTQHSKRIQTKMKEHLFEAEKYAEKHILAIAFVSRTIDAVHESCVLKDGPSETSSHAAFGSAFGAAFKPWQSDERLRDTFKERFHKGVSASGWQAAHVPGEMYFLSLLNVFESKLMKAASLVLGDAATSLVISLRQKHKGS